MFPTDGATFEKPYYPEQHDVDTGPNLNGRRLVSTAASRRPAHLEAHHPADGRAEPRPRTRLLVTEPEAEAGRDSSRQLVAPTPHAPIAVLGLAD
jgi:hypothetical protein